MGKFLPSHILFLITTMLVSSLLSSGCRTPGLGVKVYQHQVERGGMYRGQDNELVEYREANGWYCMNPTDFRKVVEFIEACRNTPNTNQEKK